jgi:branched-chain amino acid transport system ATP-binding protein
MAVLLKVEHLSVRYGPVLALDDVSFAVERGSIFAVLGPNGAGKTSLLRAVAGVVRPAGGDIWFEGTLVTPVAPHLRARMGLVYQPETRELFGGLTVTRNIALGAEGPGRSLDPARLKEILSYFPGLEGKLDRRPNTMSGGEQQMVALARSMAAEPKLLAIDEPSLGLSPQLVTRLFGVLRDIARKAGVTILLAEQNARMAMKIADEALFLRTGRTALAGPVAALQSRDLSSYYLGASG